MFNKCYKTVYNVVKCNAKTPNISCLDKINEISILVP